MQVQISSSLEEFTSFNIILNITKHEWHPSFRENMFLCLKIKPFYGLSQEHQGCLVHPLSMKTICIIGGGSLRTDLHGVSSWFLKWRLYGLKHYDDLIYGSQSIFVSINASTCSISFIDSCIFCGRWNIVWSPWILYLLIEANLQIKRNQRRREVI